MPMTCRLGYRVRSASVCPPRPSVVSMVSGEPGSQLGEGADPGLLAGADPLDHARDPPEPVPVQPDDEDRPADACLFHRRLVWTATDDEYVDGENGHQNNDRDDPRVEVNLHVGPSETGCRLTSQSRRSLPPGFPA